MSTQKDSMLFINRSKGERIFIGEGKDQVTIEVTRLNKDKCMLTMYAPRHVKIDRAERRLEEQN